MICTSSRIVKKPAPIEIGFEGQILQYSTCKPAHTTVEAILDYYGDLCEEPLELWHGNTKFVNEGDRIKGFKNLVLMKIKPIAISTPEKNCPPHHLLASPGGCPAPAPYLTIREAYELGMRSKPDWHSKLDVIVREDNERGVIAKKAFKAGEFVCEFEANLLTEEEMKLAEEYERDGIPVYSLEGSAFGQQILTVIQNNAFFAEMISYNHTADGSALYTTFFQTVASTFPQYLEELRGMADGANVSFSKLFLWNMMFEWQTLLDHKHLPTPSCSDLYLATEGRALMGHNEDGDKINVNTSFMVHVRITRPATPAASSETSSVQEEYTALCYAAELCGNAFGFNVNAGLVYTCNAVFPKNINTSAVPRNYLNRLALSVDTAQFLSTLQSTPCSSGFSFNIGQLDSLAVTNMEVWPGGFNVFKVSGYNYHFNMYMHSDPDQYDDPSTDHRLARVKQLAPPTNSSGILSILGDTWDHKYPIYRTGVPPDTAATITTALFDLQKEKKMFYMYRGNPAMMEPSLIIPLL